MFANHTEIKRLLRIANRHLGYIKRSRSKGIAVPGKMDHAVVTSIFSAAAVELGLNLFITIHILSIQNDRVRTFYGVLVTKYLRLLIRRKYEFVCEFCPKVKKDKELKREVLALFEYRNSVLHSSPDYIEPYGIPDEWAELPNNELPKEVTYEDLIQRPALIWQAGWGSLGVEESFKHYQAANDFIANLDICYEKFDEYPSPFPPPLLY
jgi:hypothetical protein